MSDPETNPPPRTPHPDFDGHLERPLSSMTGEERLAWAWEGALLLDLARRSREASRRQKPEQGHSPPADQS